MQDSGTRIQPTCPLLQERRISPDCQSFSNNKQTHDRATGVYLAFSLLQEAIACPYCQFDFINKQLHECGTRIKLAALCFKPEAFSCRPTLLRRQLCLLAAKCEADGWACLDHSRHARVSLFLSLDGGNLLDDLRPEGEFFPALRNLQRPCWPDL
jgi:hypothetical protein